jgi:hypothetical protein
LTAVALFKRILTPIDLPLEDFSREGLALDVKGKDLRSYKQVDLAEQVAAYANVTGGVILVGANEQPGGTAKYDPMTEADANANRTRYEQAAKEYCSPNPLVEPAVLARDGGFVVAINVWPFPGQAIGVRTGTKDKQSFIFPFRIATQTKFLEAEQLPMLMLSDIRKNAIVLDQIPANTQVQIIDYDGAKQLFLIFVEVLPERNCFVLDGQGSGKGLGAIQTLKDIRLPLDIVNLVWNERGAWKIAIKGQLGLDGTYLPQQNLRSR